MVRSTLRIIFFILISLASAESATFKELVKSQAEITPNISIFIKNLSTNEVIVSYRANKRMIPASNQKIITTLTSLDLLGEEFKFSTYIFLLDKIDEKGIYSGNIYIDSRGDPSLSSSKLKDAVNFFKEKDLKVIQGNIIINDTYFESPEYNKNWKNSWKGSYWAPYISSIAVDNNLYKSGDTLLLTDNPLYLLGVKFRKILRSKGIILKGNIVLKEIPLRDKLVPFKIIYEINSPSLSKLVYIVNKESDNLYAEHLFKKFSAHYMRTRGSWIDSQKITRKFLTEKVKLNSKDFNLDDGSGLSKYNKITTKSIAKLLEYSTKQDYFEVFFNSLPIAGKDGTLLKRFKNKPLYLNLRAKTGYIKGVSSLSGFFKGKDNETYVFSIIVNDHNYSIRSFIDRLLSKIYYY